jgi:hypothetical protein
MLFLKARDEALQILLRMAATDCQSVVALTAPKSLSISCQKLPANPFKNLSQL